jgi:hypothetical protein
MGKQVSRLYRVYPVSAVKQGDDVLPQLNLCRGIYAVHLVASYRCSYLQRTLQSSTGFHTI